MSILTSELAIAIIQAIVSVLKSKGLSDEEIDRVMVEGRKEKKARPIEDLPKP